jgi:hypothetical protein
MTVEVGQTWEQNVTPFAPTLFTIVELRGERHCALLCLEGSSSGQIMWEWVDNMTKQHSTWRRLA